MELAAFTSDLGTLGTRPALVFLAPFPYDHRIWRSVASRLEGLPIVAFDPPGFGQSPVCNRAPSLSTYADLVAESLRELGVNKAVLVGNSMGGYTAMAFAESHRAMLAGLALVGTNAAADTDAAKARRTELALSAVVGRAQYELSETADQLLSPDTLVSHPQLLQLLRQWVMEAPGEGIAWAARAMAARPPRLHILNALNIPAVVIRGNDDTASTADQAREMSFALACDLVELPKVGHLVPVEEPGALARALRKLYNQC